MAGSVVVLSILAAVLMLLVFATVKTVKNKLLAKRAAKLWAEVQKKPDVIPGFKPDIKLPYFDNVCPKMMGLFHLTPNV